MTGYVATQQDAAMLVPVGMQETLRYEGFEMKQRLAHLDRIAGQLNALLVVLAVGLGVLDLTVLVGKGMMAAIAANLPPQQTIADTAHSGPPPNSVHP